MPNKTKHTFSYSFLRFTGRHKHVQLVEVNLILTFSSPFYFNCKHRPPSRAQTDHLFSLSLSLSNFFTCFILSLRCLLTNRKLFNAILTSISCHPQSFISFDTSLYSPNQSLSFSLFLASSWPFVTSSASTRNIKLYLFSSTGLKGKKSLLDQSKLHNPFLF